MGRIEVITRVERRRRWSEAEKAAVLGETDAADANVAAVGRKHGIARSVVYNCLSARRAQAIAAIPGVGPVELIPMGVLARPEMIILRRGSRYRRHPGTQATARC